MTLGRVLVEGLWRRLSVPPNRGDGQSGERTPASARTQMGHIQATGIDEARREQYTYHPKWTGAGPGGSSPPDVVHIIPVGDRVDDVSLGDQTYRPIGELVVDHDQRRRVRMLHQIRGRSQMRIRFRGC